MYADVGGLIPNLGGHDRCTMMSIHIQDVPLSPHEELGSCTNWNM